MEKVFTITRTETIMKVNGLMIKELEKGKSFSLTALNS